MQSQLKLQPQTFWGWLLALYLFLAGAGAGAYLVGVIFDYMQPGMTILPYFATVMGPSLVAIGTVFLLLDLGQTASFMRAPLNPRTSWISRGTIIISAFMVLGFIQIGIAIWPFTWLAENQNIRYVFESVNMIFACLAMVYTGLLLSASRTIALWRTLLLPAVFFVSALSTGVMSLSLSLTISGLISETNAAEQVAELARADIVIILAECLIIFSYLWKSSRSQAKISVDLITKGRFAPHFWVGVVAAGLLTPSIVEVIDVTLFDPSGSFTVILATVPGLIGGLMLRWVIIRAGIKVPINVGELLLPIDPTPEADKMRW